MPLPSDIKGKLWGGATNFSKFFPAAGTIIGAGLALRALRMINIKPKRRRK